MPIPSSKMNDYERAICSRFGQLRRGLKLSQRNFAASLAINRDMVASIEYGRTPLRFDIGLSAAVLTGCSVAWLAEGISPKLGPLPSADLIHSSLDDWLFSEVWKQYLKRSMEAKGGDKAKHSNTEDQVSGKIFHGHLNEELSGILKFLPVEFHENFYLHISKAGHDFVAFNLPGIVESRSGFGKNRQNQLTITSLKSNNADVKSQIRKLIERVKRKASKPGAKAELAKRLDVAPARVSEWLSGKKEPGGEYTLRLLNWVEQE
jgi:DNA-binding transcriptional regulator YiaG